MGRIHKISRRRAEGIYACNIIIYIKIYLSDCFDELVRTLVAHLKVHPL